jgi:hypothetical protein
VTTQRGVVVRTSLAHSRFIPYKNPDVGIGVKRVSINYPLMLLVVLRRVGGWAAEVIKPLGGWEAKAPREEIRPQFEYDSKGGFNGTTGYLIRTDGREGLDGCWTRIFPVIGRKDYAF